MRSFSIVQAWFFACLVVIIGEVQAVGDTTMCRYRKFGKDFRFVRTIQMSEPLPTGTYADPATGKAGQFTKHQSASSSLSPAPSNRKAGNKRKSDPKKGNSDKRISVRAINTFYPSCVAVHKGDISAIKFPNSSFEVNLKLHTQNVSNTSTFTLQNVLTYETTNTLGNTLHLGGVQFHDAVVRAAFKANQEFLNTGATFSQSDLLGAFYTILANSRSLYALLVTAYRCQNCVNVVDEDGIFLAPVFNNHRLETFVLDGNYPPTTEFGTGTTTPENTYMDIIQRQALCFSSPISNAAWNQLWGSALQIIRLPKGWMHLLESLFSSTHLVLPTDFNSTPRFVTLWPDGEYINYDAGASVCRPRAISNAYVDYSTSGTPVLTLGNTSIATLSGLVTNLTSTFSNLMRLYPQLELMFEYLGCKSDSIDFDFTRDITSRTLYVNNSYDISKFIFDTAVPVYAAMQNGNIVGATYKTFDKSTFPTWISEDPNIHIDQRKDTKFDPRLAPEAIKYTDACSTYKINELLFMKRIAPLSVHWYHYAQPANSTTRTGDYISDFSGNILPGSLLPDIATQFTATYAYNVVNGLMNNELDRANHIVKPRSIAEWRSLTLSTAGVATLVAAGYIPLMADTTSATDWADAATYSLKDYIVPSLVVQEAVDRELDIIIKS